MNKWKVLGACLIAWPFVAISFTKTPQEILVFLIIMGVLCSVFAGVVLLAAGRD